MCVVVNKEWMKEKLAEELLVSWRCWWNEISDDDKNETKRNETSPANSPSERLFESIPWIIRDTHTH